MGPYCDFCNRRCFVHLPENTPTELIHLYEEGITIIATCLAGQGNEKANFGTCYGDIMTAIEQVKAEAVRWIGFDFYEQEEEGQQCYVFIASNVFAQINQLFGATDRLPNSHISSRFGLPTHTLMVVGADNDEIEEMLVEEHVKQVGEGSLTVYTVDETNQQALTEYLQANRIAPDSEHIVVTATECSLRAVIGKDRNAEDYLTVDIPRTFFQT